MRRCGCPEEEVQQTATSPGVVLDDEPIIFALIEPITAERNVGAKFSKSKLIERSLSVCRGAHMSYADLLEHVVDSVVRKESRRKYIGYHWATCGEIRAIMSEPKPGRSGKGEAGTKEFGAFCVIDDANGDHLAHAVIGFSRPADDFWSKNDRLAAQQNLKRVFEARGIMTEPATPPLRG